MKPPPRPVTFRAAEGLGAFELAQLWADRTAWPIDERTQYDELSELAVMSALCTRGCVGGSLWPYIVRFCRAHARRRSRGRSEESLQANL